MAIVVVARLLTGFVHNNQAMESLGPSPKGNKFSLKIQGLHGPSSDKRAKNTQII